MSKKCSIPRGTADVLPAQMPLWQDIETTARRILTVYNYREIRTPLFEETALFQRSLGQTSDVVNKQLLTLSSDKKESFALRPEGTAPVVRAYVENHMDHEASIAKLFYVGPMFRGERPQKGRLRQFHQVGVEVIGANTLNPLIDAEVIALNVELLRRVGVKDFRLNINTLGSTEDKASFSKQLRKIFKPRITKFCPDCRDRFDRNVFRILDCKNEACRALVAGADIGYDHLSPESKKYYDQVKAALKNLGVDFKEVPVLVRGLDYYTHTVFEISAASLGSQDALSAGGRYEDLVAQLGGPQVDAIGFALGIERVILALSGGGHEVPSKAPEYYFINLDEKYTKNIFELAQKTRKILNENGGQISCDLSYSASSMKSQMRLADKLKAHYVVILGEDEVKKGTVSVKDMTQGQQFEKTTEEFLRWAGEQGHKGA